MSRWIADRLPTVDDADVHGLVRWGLLQPGLLMPWQDVRPGEAWARSAAWQPPMEGSDRG